VNRLYPKFTSIWKRHPDVTDQEWKEMTELNDALRKEVESWFVEPADEAVSGG
jgi:hypothetical protein